MRNDISSEEEVPSGKRALISNIYSPSGRLLYSLVRATVKSDHSPLFRR